MQEPPLFILCGSFFIPALLAIPLAKLRLKNTKQEFNEAWFWWFCLITSGWLTLFFGYKFTITDNDGFSIPFWLFLIGTIILISEGKQKREEENTKKPIKKTPNSNLQKYKKKTMNYKPGDSVTCKVVGVSFGNRQEIIRKLKRGDSIKLIREYDNPHDPNSIMVLYWWSQIGYISANLAQILTERFFDRYNMQKLDGIVTHIYTDNPTIPIGVEIGFYLPYQGTLETHLENHPHINNQTTGQYRLNELSKLEEEFINFLPELKENILNKEVAKKFEDEFITGISSIKKSAMTKKEIDAFTTAYREQLSDIKNAIEKNKKLSSLREDIQRQLDNASSSMEEIQNEDSFDEDAYWDDLAEKSGE